MIRVAAALMAALMTVCTVERPIPDIPWDSITGTKVIRDAIELNNIVEETGRGLSRRIAGQSSGVRDGLNEDMRDLYDELDERIGELGGDWSLYLKRLDDGQVIEINAEKPMVAASLIKLFVAGAYYSAVESGELQDEDFGNAPDVMLSRSDNGATNRLIDALGRDRINAFIKHWRISPRPVTVLNRKMLEDNGTENYTTAKDCGRMLEEVLEGRYVNGDASARILEDLKEQERRNKIPAGVPEGIQTANKTGELAGVDNDAAIIWGERCTYILCIMSSGNANAIHEIAEISQLIYVRLSQEPPAVVQ